MAPKLENKEIVNFLCETEFKAGLFDTLKIRYRTYICPFIDLISLVKPGDKVGDVGCGSGQFLLLVSKFADNPESVYGIEITERLIHNAKELFSQNVQIKHHFETFDGSNFPEELGKMDIIFLIDVLHHVPKKQQESFLANLTAIMKPGARLVLKDINASSPLVLFNKMHDMVFAGEIGNELKMDRAKELLEKNKLKIIKQDKRRMYVYPHYTLVAQKN
ncbi:MAG: class I SAM-dependent methyltransferase [Chitinophagaceae bacterium]|nr:class I SAM-dependent methyltransferase [Chitinophagaceae bacterium]